MPTFVQKKLVESNNLATNSTTLSFDSSITAGSLIVFMVGWNDATATLSSISDGTNTLVAIDDATTSAGGNASLSTRYWMNHPGGTPTFTLTWSTNITGVRIIAHEASGVATASALDQHGTKQQTAPGNGTDTIATDPVTTTTSGQYIFGATFEYLITGFTPAAGTGFTLREGPPGDAQASEDQIQSSAGSIAVKFSPSAGGGQNFLTAIATFKAVSSSSTGFSGAPQATLFKLRGYRGY